MALTLIKEDGTGLADANSYAAVADGDAYHEGHLYASPWTSATTERKGIALVMATKVIDAMFHFEGTRRVATQALQWPRRDCPDRDAGAAFVDENTVPADLRAATCELARELLRVDRTDAPEGEGLRSLTLDGAMKVIFDPLRRRPVLPALVQAMLDKYGDYQGARAGAVRLVRV